MTEAGFGCVQKNWRGEILLAGERWRHEENRAESRRAGVAVGRYRSDSDAGPKVVSQALRRRTNRVTENRINTGHFTRFLHRSLLFKKHREHALGAHCSPALGSLHGGSDRATGEASCVAEEGTRVRAV